MIAAPSYDYTLETYSGKVLEGVFFFSNEVLILKCFQGEACLLINSSEHTFRPNANFLLAEGGSMKVVSCSDDFQMNVLRFSPNFFNGIYPLLDSKTIEVSMRCAPDLYTAEEMQMTDLMFHQLCLLYPQHTHTYRNKIALNLTLSYVLDICEQTYKYVKDSVPDTVDHRSFLIDRFYKLCKQDHFRHRTVDYYANRLNISSRYLYKICSENLNITPKQCIDSIVSGTAKKLLLTSVLTNQQIASELNFPDQATFGQFFKRTVGMTPSEFRHRYK